MSASAAELHAREAEALDGRWLAGTPMDPAATPAEPLPPLPGFPFLIASTAAIIVGPTGGGRSSLLQAAMYDAAAGGLRCAYLGSEVTEPEFNARAADLANRRGDEIDEELRTQLGLVRYLDLAGVIAHAWEHAPEWVDGIVGRYDIVGIDPLSAVASALDLDFDQRNAEFIRFYDRLVAPLTVAGVTVAMTDNLGHAIEAKSRAKGVSAKQDRADLTFACTLSAAPLGLIVKAKKVRSVRAPFKRDDEWIFTREDQRIAPRGDAPEDPGRSFRPTNIMEKVSRLLEAEPGLTRNAIITAIGGRKANVTLALQLLIAEGFVAIERDRQAHRHNVATPYRALDDDTTGSTEAQPGPNRGPAPVPAPGPTGAPHTTVGGGVPGPGGERNGHGNRVPTLDDLEYAEPLVAEEAHS